MEKLQRIALTELHKDSVKLLRQLRKFADKHRMTYVSLWQIGEAVSITVDKVHNYENPPTLALYEPTPGRLHQLKVTKEVKDITKNAEGI